MRRILILYELPFQIILKRKPFRSLQRGRNGGFGVKNYGSTIQFTAMYYLKPAASPVFFESNKQRHNTLMIALLLFNKDFGRIFGNRKGK